MRESRSIKRRAWQRWEQGEKRRSEGGGAGQKRAKPTHLHVVGALLPVQHVGQIKNVKVLPLSNVAREQHNVVIERRIVGLGLHEKGGKRQVTQGERTETCRPATTGSPSPCGAAPAVRTFFFAA